MLPQKYWYISQLSLRLLKAGIQVQKLEMDEFQDLQEMGMEGRQEVEVLLQAVVDVLLGKERKVIVE
jgi:hypothetical protein